MLQDLLTAGRRQRATTKAIRCNGGCRLLRSASALIAESVAVKVLDQRLRISRRIPIIGIAGRFHVVTEQAIHGAMATS